MLEEAKAGRLAKAIKSLEGVGKVTLAVVAHLGIGTASGQSLKDCDGSKDKAEVRAQITSELLKEDPDIWKMGKGDTEAERKANAPKAISRPHRRPDRALWLAPRVGRIDVARAGRPAHEF